MRCIRPPALFELRAHEWRNAVDLHHILQEKDALVSTEARLTCPVDIPNWPAGPKLGRAKAGARGRTCTGTAEGLSFVPLHWATRAGSLTWEMLTHFWLVPPQPDHTIRIMKC